jgi:hypothetical protein
VERPPLHRDEVPALAKSIVSTQFTVLVERGPLRAPVRRENFGGRERPPLGPSQGVSERGGGAPPRGGSGYLLRNIPVSFEIIRFARDINPTSWCCCWAALRA